jgi:hypothetical protein
VLVPTVFLLHLLPPMLQVQAEAERRAQAEAALRAATAAAEEQRRQNEWVSVSLQQV